jgi:hypothetical protein
MNRRTLLTRAAVAIGGSVGLAGCSGEALEEAESKPPFLEFEEADVRLPYRESTDIVETGVRQTADADIGEEMSFDALIREYGILAEELVVKRRIIREKLEIEREEVETIESPPYGVGRVLELQYRHPGMMKTGLLRSVGLIAGSYAALVAAGFDAELLDATVLDDDQQAYGSFHVLTSWAESFNDGVTSARSYGSKPWATASTV